MNKRFDTTEQFYICLILAIAIFTSLTLPTIVISQTHTQDYSLDISKNQSQTFDIP